MKHIKPLDEGWTTTSLQSEHTKPSPLCISLYINKNLIKNVTPDNVTPLDEGWTTTNLKKDWLQKCNVNKCGPFIVMV